MFNPRARKTLQHCYTGLCCLCCREECKETLQHCYTRMCCLCCRGQRGMQGNPTALLHKNVLPVLQRECKENPTALLHKNALPVLQGAVRNTLQHCYTRMCCLCCRGQRGKPYRTAPQECVACAAGGREEYPTALLHKNVLPVLQGAERKTLQHCYTRMCCLCCRGQRGKPYRTAPQECVACAAERMQGKPYSTATQECVACAAGGREENPTELLHKNVLPVLQGAERNTLQHCSTRMCCLCCRGQRGKPYRTAPQECVACAAERMQGKPYSTATQECVACAAGGREEYPTALLHKTVLPVLQGTVRNARKTLQHCYTRLCDLCCK